MRIQAFNSNINYNGSKNAKKRQAEAIAAAIIFLQPVKISAYADNQMLNNNPPVSYVDIWKDAKTKLDDYRVVEYSDLYYAILSDGGKNEIKAHYDSGKHGAGAYYQYGNEAFTRDEGKRIKNPEKLKGFEVDKTKISTSAKNSAATCTQTSNPCYYPPINWSVPQVTPIPTPKPVLPKVDSRAPKGSDFYYAILYYGDKYKIKAHYDPGPCGIGTYYQYGPNAYDENGNRIWNPQDLYGFNKNTK